MMNSCTKICLLGVVALVWTLSPVAAQASDAPVLSLSGSGGSAAVASRSGNQFLVDFVPGREDVAGVNFDVVFEDAQRLQVDIQGCGAGVRSSHVSRCEMVAPDRMRVLVFSAPVVALPTAELVSFSVQGRYSSVSIEESSVAVSDMVGTIIRAEIY